MTDRYNPEFFNATPYLTSRFTLGLYYIKFFLKSCCWGRLIAQVMDCNVPDTDNPKTKMRGTGCLLVRIPVLIPPCLQTR
jgi:hypothetical protein